MRVFIPSPLRSYTDNRAEVDVGGGTLAEMLLLLNERYPGLRFRMVTEQDTIREHMKIFVNDHPVRDLGTSLKPDDQVHIICALSGG